jgi:hypothetical protein
MKDYDAVREEVPMLACHFVTDNFKNSDEYVSGITTAAKRHAGPDGAHDPAAEMPEEPIAFFGERANTVTMVGGAIRYPP